MSDFLATLDARAAELGIDEHDNTNDYYTEHLTHQSTHDDTAEILRSLQRDTGLSNAAFGQLFSFNQLSSGRQNLWLAARILSIQEQLLSVSDRTERDWQLPNDAARAAGKMVDAYLRAPDTVMYLPDQEILESIVEGWVTSCRLGSITRKEWGSPIKRRTIMKFVARKLTDNRGTLKTAVC